MRLCSLDLQVLLRSINLALLFSKDEEMISLLSPYSDSNNFLLGNLPLLSRL